MHRSFFFFFCVLCFVSPPLCSFSFRCVFDNIPLRIEVVPFPYREGVEGGFMFFFSTYLLYLVPLLVAVPYRESVCLFVGGAEVGLHTMSFLCLVSVFVHLAALCTFAFSSPWRFPSHC